jgi:hypothetical protein
VRVVARLLATDEVSTLEPEAEAEPVLGWVSVQVWAPAPSLVAALELV